MKKFVTALLLVSSFSVAAYAVDPVTAGLANIGKNPSYNDTYVGFWKTGAGYSLLTNGTSTYLRAPSTDGYLYLKSGTTTCAQTDNRAFSFLVPVVTNAEIHAYDTVTADGGLMAYPSIPENYATVVGGIDRGLTAYGSVVAVESNGPLMVYGTASVSNTLTVGNSITLNTSQAYKSGGGSWLGLSDARVKKDIVDFDDGLTELEKVRSVRFRYNGLAGTTASEQQYIGVIAQELEQTAPYMVTSSNRKLRETDAEPTAVKEVDPSAFTYMLINAVQELSEQNKAMKELLCKDHPKSDLCRNKAPARHLASRFAKH